MVVVLAMIETPRIGWIRALIATIGAWIIYRLIWLFGRTRQRRDIAWLYGPLGGEVIGDTPYDQAAALEGLTVERRARRGGLVPDFHALRSDGFDPARLHAAVRDFYEHTAEFTMDVWSKTYFPMNFGLALLVTTISRQVNQLNFPLSPLDTARGMSSEIILLRRADGSVRYTGWLRTLASDQLTEPGPVEPQAEDPKARSQVRVLYTGFYMTEQTPLAGACVKVVFPMPNGNATVVLRPKLGEGGRLVLDSSGRRFGDPGFYRIQARDAERVRVWHIKTLKERFELYVDDHGVLRCDHTVWFFGLPVLRLHYKMARLTVMAPSP